MHDIWSLHNWCYSESLRILAPSLSLPFLGLCVGKYGVRWVFSTEFPSVWRSQLAAACRGGSHSWGCYGYLLAMPEPLRLRPTFKAPVPKLISEMSLIIISQISESSDNVWSLLKSSFLKADFQSVVSSCCGVKLEVWNKTFILLFGAQYCNI